MDRRLWWDKFTKIKDDIVKGDPCYCKEKWGRYDTTYRGSRPGVQDELFEKVEAESERCCQYCAKHRPQIWLETGRVIHLCPICYIKRGMFIFKKKIKKGLKNVLSGAGLSWA